MGSWRTLLGEGGGLKILWRRPPWVQVPPPASLWKIRRGVRRGDVDPLAMLTLPKASILRLPEDFCAVKVADVFKSSFD